MERPDGPLYDIEKSAGRRSEISDLITGFRLIVDQNRRQWRAVRIEDGFEFDRGPLDSRLVISRPSNELRSAA